ncbi:MAG: thiamine phosphate synthase [Deltaproteobacteria bacterium]
MLPLLWLCADLDALPLDELLDRVTRVLRARPAAVWLRSGIDTPARRTFDAATRLAAIARERGGQLWVGDRADVAIAVRAHGLHVGSRGIGPRAARSLLQGRTDSSGSPARLSVAVHDGAGVRQAADVADVMVLSPLGAVPGKGQPLGPAGFADARARAPSAFVVALGGIVTEGDARLAARAGASAIAVRRALIASRDPAADCASLVDAFTAALGT